MSDFALTSSNTISMWPWAAARWSGMSSPIFVALTRAPRAKNISTNFVWPSLAHQCSGLKPWSSLKKVKQVTPLNYFHLWNVYAISHSPLLKVVFGVVQPETHLNCVVLATPVENIFHYSRLLGLFWSCKDWFLITWFCRWFREFHFDFDSLMIESRQICRWWWIQLGKVANKGRI